MKVCFINWLFITAFTLGYKMSKFEASFRCPIIRQHQSLNNKKAKQKSEISKRRDTRTCTTRGQFPHASLLTCAVYIETSGVIIHLSGHLPLCYGHCHILG
jgi:hypothetical protein